MKAELGGRCALVALVLGLVSTAWSFNPPRDTAGPLTVAIEAPDKVEALERPFEATVSLSNSGSAALSVQLEIWVIDDWRIEPKNERRIERTVELAANGKAQVPLNVVAGAKTYNALYPLHARATITAPASNEKREAHAIKILSVNAPAPKTPAKPPEIKAGLTPLARYRGQSVALQLGDEGPARTLGVGWHGSDAETGANFEITSVDRGGRRMECLSIHPPWRKDWGNIWADYDLVLPEMKPITLTFSTAIRDTGPSEPESDGAEFRVLVGQAGNLFPSTLFTRFTQSKTWEPASVDLSGYAGKHITLRLWAGPGPAHNTVCDTGYWGNPTIVVGTVPKPVAGEKDTVGSPNAAREFGFGQEIKSEAGTFDVDFAPGAAGPADAKIAFGKRRLVFQGFDIQIDGTPLGATPIAKGGEWGWKKEKERVVGEATLLCGGGPTRVRCEVWAESGALRCRFAMPAVKHDERGHPRFTLIGLGPVGGAKANRVYAGFGNVIENPRKFDLGSSGFQISTRHVGVDYDNGLSLVQASDVFPDRLQVDPERGLVQLQVRHDATISLIPSEKGAFAAAKVYREGIAGFKPAAGVAKLRGKMCLDYWGMSYQHGIETVERLVKYGVTDCVYVWHNWQRWGYDYRLPDIYPARGSHEEFLRLAETCRKHGILFAPHDNYIDFYPDAEGYSYDHIIFHEDGTPQKAWYNKGRDAQSYRWRPDAFQPWLKRNVALLNRDVKPTAYFVDVFTAIEPMDYYDYTGRFHPKTETIRKWGECFDYVREQFGGAPQISEAGSDHLIGHLDAGQSDHNGVSRTGARPWEWNAPCADAERTPWHDMASHGSFVLLAGGLASRYVGSLDVRTHGYGTDDYLSLTVLGGRNPMAQGDSSAETILTYWLLHDICKELGGRPMTRHEFADNNIHRQIVRFGNDATVSVNRGKEDWKVGDAVLPEYGFVAKAGDVRAEVTRRDGVVCGYAESPRMVFVDARPPRPSLAQANTERKVVDFGPVATNGAFRFVSGESFGGGAYTRDIIMLPGCPASEIRCPSSRQLVRVERLNPDRTVAGAVEFKQSGDQYVFYSTTGDFGYRLTVRIVK